jgi:dihydroorotate dehydrogenase (NAD+) catalytic subunit
VYEVTQAVDLPVIGTGGVLSGEDALQMVMAGATAVGIGTALHYDGDGAFERILGELAAILEREGIASLNDVRGCAHVA